MTKGDQTREMILGRAAQLFSRQGYFGASIPDIMRETGLKKGGIYNHFSSKENLVLEAFDYAVGLVGQRMRKAMWDKTNAADRLLAIVSVFRDHIDNPLLEGGCPVLNTAIEADDAHPVLRDRTRKIMDGWRELIQRTVRRGIESREIRPEVNGDELATLMISMLEGAVMMSKLYADAKHIHRVVDYLTSYIETSVRWPKETT